MTIVAIVISCENATAGHCTNSVKVLLVSLLLLLVCDTVWLFFRLILAEFIVIVVLYCLPLRGHFDALRKNLVMLFHSCHFVQGLFAKF